ncbi:LodA/GoxA family CTQ-dependent oxidase [Fulvivirga sediminis]|uniref:LodA/GoxA family CTQ-dependent oxidase n=1 Tax=Fulvivirga sediminis TaxID=2803949 RepID=A0A937F4K0_9BACT|nr:LodA/GoxA family CTQ-dependent oxidase [Fulvivirga sediminis]MBL3656271.1 LodA/GoxA family CTQ-dependent oxidase [Fulvivirga sediminis]
MSQTSLRIHPAIGMARVGNSTEYYLGPETMAARPQEGSDTTGGLPIKPNTESTTITSADLRDAQGRLKRQAARFKIFQYPNSPSSLSYPSSPGEEVKIGSVVDGKKVSNIIWTAHLANKKANCWEIDETANKGIELYKNGNTPPLRNLPFGNNAADINRLQKLIIDAGPRAINSANGSSPIKFDNHTIASYFDTSSKEIKAAPNYPIQFPASNGSESDGSTPINYLGELLTDSSGRLLVLGGHGLACGFNNEGSFDGNQPLCADVDNDNWLDDTSDGPVTAVLIFEDGSKLPIPGSAWVVVTDPAYAPQTLNVVTLWDDVYNTWLEKFDLQPEVYSNKSYNHDYQPDFNEDVFPVLNAAHMQRWTTNLPDQAVNAHKSMMNFTKEPPKMNIMSFIRKVDGSQNSKGSPLMPLSLGDANQSFLTLSHQQYFFMEQWTKGKCVGATPLKLGAGEQLDKTVLVNCLGGRFSPGIDMTFIVRDPNLYNSRWHDPNIGPFRINTEPLDYAKATKDKPFLGVGYIPLRPDPVQPGDICKFMAIPWHTDYNSCATHTPNPNPGGKITNENVYGGEVNTTLYWSWPAQRPVAVYTFKDLSVNEGNLKNTIQRFSVRGEGTAATSPMDNPDCPPSKDFDTVAMNVGRYQNRKNILTGWIKIGTVIQGTAIDDYPDSYDKDYYLEVQSEFDKDYSNLVIQWPNNVDDKVEPPEN